MVIANPIYREVIPRELSSVTADVMVLPLRSWTLPDGRLDVAALGEELARLTWAGVMPSARLQKGLAAAAARSESARHSVLQLLQALCGVAGSGPAPRGYGGLLELLLELSLDLQQPLPAATAAALAALEIGGKGAAARARPVALVAGHKAP